MFIVLAVCVLLYLLYKYGTTDFDYWKKLGVPYEKGLPYVGSTTKIFSQKMSISQYMSYIYDKYPNEELIGFFFAKNRALVVKNPELVQRILVSDFNSFYSRGLIFDKNYIEPMMKMLFTIDGDTWKLLRQRMTPAFTSGKLKAMFPLIIERVEKLRHLAAEAASSETEIDVRDLMARYTTDFIGACGFGIEADALDHEDSAIRKLGKRILQITFRDSLVNFLKRASPFLFQNLEGFKPDVKLKILAMMRSVIEKRNNKPSGRNDFIDLLMELREQGKIIGESIEKRNPDGSPVTVEMVMDELIMVAQLALFFLAGFETSSSTSSFTLHQLAFYPEEQAQCQREIDEVIERHGGKLCYEAIKEMKYLQMCFKESMRIFPSVGYISRGSTCTYTFPGTDITIDEGVMINIPVQSLHMDEKYFDNPTEFRPLRFHPDNANKIRKGTYLPFGEGPRACIGERLGMMQSVAGLAGVLSRFSVKPGPTTRKDLVIETHPSAAIQMVKGAMLLQLVARK